MKTNIFAIVFLLFIITSVHSKGNLELVNTQEISLDQKTVINVLYKDEDISLLKGTSDRLIIKEYMTERKNEYYAHINNFENTVTIEIGHRPFRPFFNFFKAHVEIYLPENYRNSLNIKTTDGRINISNEINVENLKLETTDGNITVNTITVNMISLKSRDGDIRCEYINGNISAKSSDGNISCENINGNVSLESIDGKIGLKIINGSVTAKTSDGGIICTVIDNFENIALTSKDGKVQLDLPRDLLFRFSARTSDGKLFTPFADRLYSPINDRKLVEGIIGGDNISENIPRINITTGDGSIMVNWLN